jgi:hypothetical protein
MEGELDGDFFGHVIVYSALLGVYLLILGIALAGLLSALRKRDEEKSKRLCEPYHPGPNRL